MHVSGLQGPRAIMPLCARCLAAARYLYAPVCSGVRYPWGHQRRHAFGFIRHLVPKKELRARAIVLALF